MKRIVINGLLQRKSFSSTSSSSILVVNPNTSNSFTKVIRDSLPSKHVVCVQSEDGPETIETVYDEVLSTPGTMRVLLQHEYAGAIVACFSDHPAVEAAREISHKPIVGLLDSSCSTASFLGDRFGIVTTSKSWEPLLRKGIERLGFANRCAAIRSCDGRVEHAMKMEEELILLSERIIEKDGADLIILGCAGFAGLVNRVSAHLDVPIIEPVCAAYHVCQGLVNQNLSTSKRSLYAIPKFKNIKGMDHSFETAYIRREEKNCDAKLTDEEIDTRPFEADTVGNQNINRLYHDESDGDNTTVLSYDDYFNVHNDDDDRHSNTSNKKR
mmetsp:Transcript_5081/g.7601  ORF Transcript_5081/g.7601 Transcript_5081/m.7601 type:complete len:327 (+) Transcript_5081:40-1020(+)